MENIINLLAASSFTKLDKKIGSSKVAVILRDFIFKNEMIAISIPCKIRNSTMILVSVITIMCENEIWNECFFHFFKNIFYFICLIWKKPVFKIKDINRFFPNFF